MLLRLDPRVDLPAIGKTRGAGLTLDPSISVAVYGLATLGSQVLGAPGGRVLNAGIAAGDAHPAVGRPLMSYSYDMPANSESEDIVDVEPLADNTARQARQVVAAYATDADECRVFLSMLGIGPAKLEV